MRHCLTVECQMSKRIRRRYTKEFKLQAVRQVLETDKTAAEVSRKLGIGSNLLLRWRKEYDQLEALPKTAASLAMASKSSSFIVSILSING